MILGLLPKNTILRIGFLWSIVYVVIAILGISIHNESNIMFLFPIELKASTFIKNIFFLIIPLDNIIYLLFEEQHNPKRKNILLSGILTLIFCTIQLIINLTLVNYRFYEDLENMESTVEIPKEDETKIFDDSIDTIDEFYESCASIKNDVESLQVLGMIGEDITESMQVIASRLDFLIQEAQRKFDLSDEQIDEIKNDVFGPKGRKTR